MTINTMVVVADATDTRLDLFTLLSEALVLTTGCFESLRSLLQQWSRQKSGGDSAVRSECVIAGMIFHPSRGKSQLLHKYIEQSFVEVTLLPACHREDVWLLALLHA
jgi:hypothetical protein